MLRSRMRNPARSPVSPSPVARMTWLFYCALSTKALPSGSDLSTIEALGVRGTMDQVAPIVPSAGDVAARARRWLARAAIDVRAATWVQVAVLTTLYFATAKLGI